VDNIIDSIVIYSDAMNSILIKDIESVLLKTKFKMESISKKLDKFIEFVEKVCPVGNTIASPVKMIKTNVIIER
jgi:uncharacterized OsmC-like protein